MADKGKVTIYDLAIRLHTTASTVSRALQDNPRISQKRREEVKKLAQELNYIPDPVAHHLRTGKGNVLGIIVPRIDRNFFATIISTFQAEAQKQGYQVIIAASNESEEQEKAVFRAMVAKKVDGIALSLSSETKFPLYEQQLEAQNIPLVYFDRTPLQTPSCDCVLNNNFQIGYEAVQHLYQRGCRRICHFAGPTHMQSYAERLRGYQKALEDLGLEARPEWVFAHTIRLEDGAEAAQRLLAMSSRPDGIFSSGDFSAIAALDYFRQQHIDVPRDIAVIGVANEPFDNYLSTPLASFDLHQQAIGKLSANLLLSRLNDKTDHITPPERIVVGHDLICRESAK